MSEQTKIYLKVLLFFIFFMSSTIVLFTATAYSNEVNAYDLGNGYTAVKNNVLSRLVENEKMLEVYKEEVEYYKQALEDIKSLQSDRYVIQSERISVLKDTITVKDDIIILKDMNIENYKNLYDMKTDELRTVKRKTLLDKLLVLGIGVYGVSQIDDTSGKVAVGAATLTFVLK